MSSSNRKYWLDQSYKRGDIWFLDSAIDRASAAAGDLRKSRMTAPDGVPGISGKTMVGYDELETLLCELGNLMEAARRVTKSC